MGGGNVVALLRPTGRPALEYTFRVTNTLYCLIVLADFLVGAQHGIDSLEHVVHTLNHYNAVTS
jgi:hypothetical protein